MKINAEAKVTADLEVRKAVKETIDWADKYCPALIDSWKQRVKNHAVRNAFYGNKQHREI